MNKHQIGKTVLGILSTIAPDAELGAVDPKISFHDQFEIDSIDYLRLMLALEKEFRIAIPDSDYPQLSTLEGCVDYLAGQLSAVAEPVC